MSVTGTKVNAQVRSPVSVQLTSTYVPPSFADFRRAANDVLNRNHKYGHSILAKARSSLGVYQEYGVKSSAPLTATSSLDGYLKADYAGPHFSLNSQYWTNPAVGDEITFIPTGLPKGTTLAAIAGTKLPRYGYTGDYYGALETTYKANYINATAKVITDGQKHTLDASAVLGLPYGVDGVSVGGTLLAKADNNGNTTIAAYEGGLQYKSADYVASLTSTNSLSHAVLTWHQIVASDTTVAAQFEAPLSTSGSRALHIGTSHQIDKDTLIQAKASVPTGAVSAYLEKKVGPAASLGSFFSGLPRGVLGLSLQTGTKAGGGLGLTSIENYGIKYELGEF